MLFNFIKHEYVYIVLNKQKRALKQVSNKQWYIN